MFLLLKFFISIVLKKLIGFSVLSIIMSGLMTIGGYLGFSVYFYVSFIFYIIGIIYTLYISIFRLADGWTDIVSMFSFIFTIFSYFLFSFSKGTKAL